MGIRFICIYIYYLFPVRIVGGPSTTQIKQGRIELYDQGSWKFICDENWNNQNAGEPFVKSITAFYLILVTFQ